MLRHADRYPAGSPLAVQVELTSRCNLKCRMCALTTGASSSSGSPGPMSHAVFDEVLDLARQCGRVVVAGYGEPLTSPQALPMLRALEAAGIEIHMATNGLALTPALARELAALRRLTVINVSIDSPDPDVYRDVRGGSVHRALQGLRHLMEAVEDPARVVVSAVAMQAALPSLVALPALVAEAGVRRLSLQALVDYNAYAEGQRLLGRGDLRVVLERIERACDEHGVRLEVWAPERLEADVADASAARRRYYGTGEWDPSLTRQCKVPWDIPYVDKDGRVFPCCFAGSANVAQVGQVGPAGGGEPLASVWHGAALAQFRRSLVDGATTPDICRRCTVAPLGTHEYREWSAVVQSGSVAVRRGRRTAVATVVVRNDGTATWAPGQGVHVGTSGPRDCESPIESAGWLSATRPATFAEAAVAPGGTATFTFPVLRPRGPATTAVFELVCDGVCWIPGTRFAVTVPGRPLTPLHGALAAARSAPGPLARVARRVTPRPLRRALKALAT